MNKKVIIIGAGGHAKVIRDIIEANGDKVKGFLDDKAQSTDCFNILGTVSDAESFSDGETEFFVAIGNGTVREKLMALPLKWYTAVHPSAVISPYAEIGEGTCVMPYAVINSNAKIGRGVIVNTCSSVDHDCKIGNFSHISCGAHVAGTVYTGDRVWLGAGSATRNNINICSDVLVGVGGAVVKDIKESGTYVGVPAKKIK